MKQHSGSLCAMGIVAAIIIVLAFHGMKDETLLAILATGAVGIGNAIAGVKTNAPGTASVTSVNVPADSATTAPSEPPQ